MRKTLLIHPEELSKKWVDRARDIGCNVLALHPAGGAEAHLYLEKMIALFETRSFRELIDYALNQGLEIEYEMHAARYLMPESLFSQHPEYFRMNENGERTPDFNFCVSEPGALEYIAERALKLVKKLYGSSHNYYLWLDDVKESGCRCVNCRNLSPSDQQLTVMNHIIRRFREEIPDARLAYLAYHDCAKAPETVRPAEGIFLEYAPIEKWYKDSTVRIEDLKENIEKLFGCFGKRGSRVLEYWFDNSLFSGWKKPPVKFVPDNDVIKKEIAYYNSLGFEEAASFACYLGEDYEALYGEADLSAFV